MFLDTDLFLCTYVNGIDQDKWAVLPWCELDNADT